MKKILVQGKVQGIVLKSEKPINFLGTVEKKSGVITDENHDLFNKSIKDSVLVFPNGVGSSVGAYTIYSIKSNDSAPLAMICKKADLTVATGCALANIPLVMVSDEEFSSFQSGQKISSFVEYTHPKAQFAGWNQFRPIGSNKSLCPVLRRLDSQFFDLVNCKLKFQP